MSFMPFMVETSAIELSLRCHCGSVVARDLVMLHRAWFVFALLLLPVSVPAQTHDSILIIPGAVHVKIRPGSASVSKLISVLVRNGDLVASSSHPIEVQVTSDCPAGTIAAGPDFQTSTPAIDNIAEISAGRVRRAITRLQIASADFTSVNHRAPQRCTLTFTADTPISGNTDPTPSNNVVTVEINVVDFNDPEQDSSPEILVESFRAFHPKKVRVGPGRPVAVSRYRPTITNSASPALPGSEVTLSVADGDCPPGSVGLADLDAASDGDQNAVLLTGGSRRSGFVPVTIDGALFQSTSHTSPDRCTAILTASGSGGDTDPSNNTTRIIINVIDDSDF